jgi:hypothetical protein
MGRLSGDRLWLSGILIRRFRPWRIVTGVENGMVNVADLKRPIHWLWRLEVGGRPLPRATGRLQITLKAASAGAGTMLQPRRAHLRRDTDRAGLAAGVSAI